MRKIDQSLCMISMMNSREVVVKTHESRIRRFQRLDC